MPLPGRPQPLQGFDQSSGKMRSLPKPLFRQPNRESFNLGLRCRPWRRRMNVELRMGYAQHPFVEPTDDVFKTFDAMPGLPRAREFMRLAWKDNHGRWTFQVLEGAEQLLAA